MLDNWQRSLTTIPEPDAAQGGLAAEPPVPLSLFMIVKNEEKSLGRVLEQARRFCDEMIVVDTGSEDGTVALAEFYGAQVHHFAWIDDFAAARNFAMSKCTKPWMMWLDADDVIPESTVQAILKMKRTVLREDLRTVFAPYHYEYNEQGNVAVNLNRERFLKNGIGHTWLGRIHETIGAPWENSCRIEEVVIEHRTLKELNGRKLGRNLRIFEQYIDIEKHTLRELFLYGSELQAVQRRDEALKVFQKYLERAGTTIDAVGERYSVLLKMADTYYQMGKNAEAVHYATECIKLDPGRAEGYSIFGAILFFGGYPQQALPLLVGALQCTVPPPNISLVVQKLYNDIPLQLIAESAVKMKSTHMIDRIKWLGAAFDQVMPAIQEAISKGDSAA